MPPVRWKLFLAVTLICLTQKIVYTEPPHETVPMTSDGWRPIIGTSHRDVEEEITLYKNPSQTDENSKPVKAQPAPVFTPPPTSSTKPYQTITTKEIGSSVNTAGNKPQSIKVSPSQKLQKPLILISNHGHGPHIPLTSSNLRAVSSLKHPSVNKHQPPHGKKRLKPIRGQMMAHSNKYEVYVPAPSSSIGAFTFFNQPQGPIKLRETQGIPGVKQFHFSQFQPHVELAGPFAISGIPGPSDTIIQQVPVQTLLIQNRNPIQNNGKIFSNQNDEYTRNLVPPPYKPIQQDKDKKPNYKQQEQMAVVTELDTTVNNPQLVIGKHKDQPLHRGVVPENIIVQLPPPFGQPSQFSPNFIQHKPKEPVEVQVTKEKLKVFHNHVPQNYNPVEDHYQDYQDVNKSLEETKAYSFESSHLPKKQQKQEIKQQVYRKPIVEAAFPIFEEPKREIYKKPVSQVPNFPTYEVTEGKNWHDVYQPFFSTRPSIPQEPIAAIPQQQQEPIRTPPPLIRMHPQQMEIAFLPTPYTGDLIPTSPTQSEVSDIYTELNNRNRHYQYSTLDPNFFSIKEVSTHYPIVGRPEQPTIFSVPVSSPENTEFSNEITTANKEEKNEPLQIHQPVVEEPEPTIPPTKSAPTRDYPAQRQRPLRRRRPVHRTRTTTTTTTTTTEKPVTEVYDIQKTQSVEENYSAEVQRPHRRRRPVRVRTTTTVAPETTQAEEVERPVRQRYRTRVRPTASAETIEEMPSNHKMTEAVSYSGGLVQPLQDSILISDINNQFKTPPTASEEVSVSFENEVAKVDPKPEIGETENETENYPKVVSYGKSPSTTESQGLNSHGYQVVTEKIAEQTETATVEELPNILRKRMRTTTTTEQPLTSNILTPENEVDYDYSTPTTQFEPTKEAITIQEVLGSSETEKETTLTTTVATTSSTTETTTKSHRIRGRPIKYDNKNRPRFSVKEYRQRLNQYSSTSTETPTRSTTEFISNRRIPLRTRKPSVTALLKEQEEEPTERTKFTPKNPKHGHSSNGNGNEVTEKKINTRLRPFGRQRSTTEATTTTQRISIKPNIFSNLRRPPPLSLRQRILSKQNRTSTVEKTTPKPNDSENESESSDALETTLTYSSTSTTETVPEIETKRVVPAETTTEEVEESQEDTADMEIMKNESYLQSQRVSDLTSSAQKEYDTPGLFKAVSPNSRRIPNYFTISTDDPILPIEAFFPNIKDKLSKNDSS